MLSSSTPHGGAQKLSMASKRGTRPSGRTAGSSSTRQYPSRHLALVDSESQAELSGPLDVDTSKLKPSPQRAGTKMSHQGGLLRG